MEEEEKNRRREEEEEVENSCLKKKVYDFYVDHEKKMLFLAWILPHHWFLA